MRFLCHRAVEREHWLPHCIQLNTSVGEKKVARAIAGGLEKVDIESNLKAAALDSLPLYLRAQPTLYQLLEADTKAAKDASPQRSAFTYVDFTHKDLLPLWMSSEAVIGHGIPTTSLGAVGRAFKGALEKQGTSVAWCSGVLFGLVML